MAEAKVDVRALAREANELLRRIGTVRRDHERKQAQLDAKVQALKDRHGPAIEELAKEEKALVQQLAELVLPHFVLLAAKGTKTIKLRSGTISHRVGKPKLEVEDEKRAINWLRRHGMLRQHTRVGKRSLNKDSLKNKPGVVAQVPGLDIVQDQSLVIKPSTAQGEIIHEAKPLSVVVSEPTEN